MLTQPVQGKLGGTTWSLGPGNFVCYIRYLVISAVNKQYKTKQIISVGWEKTVCYIRFSNLFICFIDFHDWHRHSKSQSIIKSIQKLKKYDMS